MQIINNTECDEYRRKSNAVRRVLKNLCDDKIHGQKMIFVKSRKFCSGKENTGTFSYIEGKILECQKFIIESEGR